MVPALQRTIRPGRFSHCSSSKWARCSGSASATKEAEAHGESVPSAGKAVTVFAQKLKARCAVLLRQGDREDRRKRERLPCHLTIEIQTPRGPVAAAVYEI